MRKTILFTVFMLLALVACSPAAEEPAAAQDTPQAASPSEPAVTEEVTKPADTTPAAPAETAQPEKTESAVTFDYEPYTQLGCENLMTEEEFASTCNATASELVVTYRVGTRNCFVNIKHRDESRLTAGITLTKHEDAKTAMSEFERRGQVLKLGMDSAVGQRTYMFPKQDRETVNFVEGDSIVEVGADTRLCSKHDLVVLSRKVDAKLRAAQKAAEPAE